MRHLSRSLPVLLTAGLVGVCMADAASIDFVLPLSAVDVVPFEGRDHVVADGGLVAFEEGMPNLPGYSWTLVVPQGTMLTGVSVEIVESVAIEGTFNVDPVRVCTVSGGPGAFLESPRAWWLDGSWFPESSIADIATGNKSGFRLASFTFVPFSYCPSTGELTLVTEAVLTPVIEPDPEAPRISLTPTQMEVARAAVSSLVSNPEMVDEYAPVLRQGGSDWAPWIAIGDGALESNIQPLLDHRSSNGIPSDYLTLDWVYANYTGYDTQEQIRNCIIDGFENHGVVYVLIVGDYGETMRMSSLTQSGSTLNSAADLYYSDLDGTWDANGNHLYGELTDMLDYYSDVYVGRFSAQNATELTTMVDKTIDYETAPNAAWQTRALLCGAALWPMYGYYGSFVCDSIANRTPAGWTDYKLYESSSGHPNNQITLLNSGVSFVAPEGHGYYSGVYWYYDPNSSMFTNGQISSMTNIDKLPVFTSIACLTGRLQNNDCFAEWLMKWTGGGAVGSRFNSNNGIGTPPSTGPSEWLDIRFAQKLFVEGWQEVCVAHALAKDAFYGGPGMPMKYWCTQELNFLGDPALLFVPSELGVEQEEGSGGPGAFIALSGSYPNPFSDGTTVGYAVSGPCQVRVEVFDMSGRLVRTLHDGMLPAGEGSLCFDGLDESGRPLPSGVYAVVMGSGTASDATSVLLLR